jgi:hypothetical protein
MENKYLDLIKKSENYTNKETCIKDFLTTAEFWQWSGDNSEKVTSKRSWPKYKKIENLLGECSFCHYFEYNCIDCPFSKKFGRCPLVGSIYLTWNSLITADPERRAMFTKQVIKDISYQIEMFTRRFIEFLKANL